MIILTEEGKKEVQFFIEECKAKRKEILDAKKDTAKDTRLPTEQDIVSDIGWLEEDGEYLNSWAVTDNYDSDYPLNLIRNTHYIEKKSVWIVFKDFDTMNPIEDIYIFTSKEKAIEKYKTIIEDFVENECDGDYEALMDISEDKIITLAEAIENEACSFGENYYLSLVEKEIN